MTKISVEKKINRDNRHNTDNASKSKAPNFGDARTIENDFIRVETKSKKNESPNRQ